MEGRLRGQGAEIIRTSQFRPTISFLGRVERRRPQVNLGAIRQLALENSEMARQLLLSTSTETQQSTDAEDEIRRALETPHLDLADLQEQ